MLLDRLKTRGPDAFLRGNYQVGYGHKSIGDLGEAVSIHGVSMLCAKAIQDFPLYRGQESSTRYIDFSRQPFLNPDESEAGSTILEAWRSFYLQGYDAMIPHLTRHSPRGEGEDEKVYEKAIRARAFDVMRAFLPAGASTNVAWIGDLRHVERHLGHAPPSSARRSAGSRGRNRGCARGRISELVRQREAVSGYRTISSRSRVSVQTISEGPFLWIRTRDNAINGNC